MSIEGIGFLRIVDKKIEPSIEKQLDLH